MITTKGIIEKVEHNTATGVTQYRVRLPIFHEVEGSSEISSRDLPLAIYPLPPHMEKTILRVGDLVECTLEDGGIDNVVILGLLPHSEIRDVSASDSTESKIVMENVDSISFNEKGSAVLPVGIKIRTDDTTDVLIEGENRNYVNGEELSYIRGLNSPLVQTLQMMQEYIDYLSDTLLNLEVVVDVLEEGIEEEQ